MPKGLRRKGAAQRSNFPSTSASKNTSCRRKTKTGTGSVYTESTETVYDLSVYKQLHRLTLEWPCLSFDWCRVPENFKDDGELWLLLGSQARFADANALYLLHLSGLALTASDGSSSSSGSDSETESEIVVDLSDLERADDRSTRRRRPKISAVRIPRGECTNRVRCLPQAPHVAACWGESSGVSIFNLADALTALPPQAADTVPFREALPTEPVFRLLDRSGQEGFALDWSTLQVGMLAVGDIYGQLAIIQSNESGWAILQPNGDRMLRLHGASIEDLQWSPTEPSLIASCSCDRSIKVLDLRAANRPAIELTEAHPCDVNAIAWNRRYPKQIISGDDQGQIHVWDLRMSGSIEGSTPVASLSYHKDPIYSLEWNRIEPSMFCATCGDGSVSIWDLSLEPLFEEDPARLDRKCDGLASSDSVDDIPAQLLFLHEGLKSAKESHLIETSSQMDCLAALGQVGLHILLPSNIYAENS